MSLKRPQGLPSSGRCVGVHLPLLPWKASHIPVSVLVQAWVTFQGCLEAAKACGDAAAAAAAARVEPLELLQPGNAEQVLLVQAAVGRLPQALAQWLEHCFAATSEAAATQLTASGHDLGSDLLFPQAGVFSSLQALLMSPLPWQ